MIAAGLRRCTVFMTAVVLVMLAGCGNAERIAVRGTVTLDGQPLKTGAVTFHPAEPGPLGFAEIQSDGSFSASTGTESGLVAGTYVATVVATEPVAQSDPKQPPLPPKVLTPTRYGNSNSSDLHCIVAPGMSPLKLEMTSQEPPK